MGEQLSRAPDPRDRERARELRRIKAAATLLLVSTAVLFGVARYYEPVHWAWGYVAAFAAARVVVAPHGAGLANVVFCRPGSRVVEFFNRSYVNPCFEQWAHAARLDYHGVVPHGEEPVGRERRANREDITADVCSIIASLDQS